MDDYSCSICGRKIIGNIRQQKYLCPQCLGDLVDFVLDRACVYEDHKKEMVLDFKKEQRRRKFRTL